MNSSISYNTINGTYVWGGGVFTRFGQTHFINSVLVQNKANSKYLRSTGSTSTSYHGSARGGAIYYDLLASFGDNPNYTSKDPEIQVINSTIADNQVNPVSTSTPSNLSLIHI